MKFIHAADIHLDSPLRGLERYEGAPAAELRQASRRALENLVALCIEESADFVLIAGDIYDGDWRDYNTGLFFSAQMSRLREAGIKVFIVRGNHDAASQLTKHLTYPGNVEVFPHRKPATIRLENLGVAIHGQSFATQSVAEDLSATYPEPVDGVFNIGLLHTCAEGRAGHENYAPCTVERLVQKRYEYWALGHVHQREELHRDPWIIFPGNLQGRHARETGSKGCTVVTVERGRVESLKHHCLDVARWCQCVVNINGAKEQDEVLNRTRKALEAELRSADDRLLAVRLRFEGAGKAHATLVARPSQFLNECRATANDLTSEGIWIERMEIKTRPGIDLDQAILRPDAIGELLRYMRQVQNEPNDLENLSLDLLPLLNKLPSELREGPEALTLNAGFVRSVLPEIEHLLIPRLLEKEVAS